VGESLGRNVLSTGQDVLLREKQPSFGAANVGAHVSVGVWLCALARVCGARVHAFTADRRWVRW
jgi:hypothetical protein